jgi:hypothetical protein
MANLVITSTTNSISVVFNDFASAVGYNQATYAKRDILSIKQINDDRIEVYSSTDKWTVSYTNGTIFFDYRFS